MDSLTEKRYRLIDEAIHASTVSEITIAHQKYPVEVSADGFRFVTWEGGTFIQQDTERKTHYGRLARRRRVTRIMRPSGQRWGLMIDGDIELE